MTSELQDVYVYENGCLLRYEEVPKRYTKSLVNTFHTEASVFTINFLFNEKLAQAVRDPFSIESIPRIPVEVFKDLAFQAMPNGWNFMKNLQPILQTVKYG